MAQKAGLSQTAIVRIWRAFGLQSHRVQNFKLSKDPQFVEKVRGIVGLYLNPPGRAVVLCVDEKSQVQALNRTQPILPLSPGVPARQSHGYKRHGVTSLFAALDVASGVNISSCYRQHRHQEFLRFLNDIDASLPRGVQVHLVMDNYGTHKVKKVRLPLAAAGHPLVPRGSDMLFCRSTENSYGATRRGPGVFGAEQVREARLSSPQTRAGGNSRGIGARDAQKFTPAQRTPVFKHSIPLLATGLKGRGK